MPRHNPNSPLLILYTEFSFHAFFSHAHTRLYLHTPPLHTHTHKHLHSYTHTFESQSNLPFDTLSNLPAPLGFDEQCVEFRHFRFVSFPVDFYYRKTIWKLSCILLAWGTFSPNPRGTETGTACHEETVKGLY